MSNVNKCVYVYEYHIEVEIVNKKGVRYWKKRGSYLNFFPLEQK